MKTLKKTDKKALIVVAAILAALVLGSLTACAMQKAGAVEETESAPIEETYGSLNDEGMTDSRPDDGSEALVEEDAVAESEGTPEAGKTQTPAETAGDPTSVVQGGNAANPAPASQAATSSGHKHSWEPIIESQKVIDAYAYEETQYRTEECLICKVCNADVTNGDKDGRSATEHGKAHTLAGQNGGCYSSTKRVPCGVIKHEEKSHFVDKVTGYKCSCGATK